MRCWIMALNEQVDCEHEGYDEQMLIRARRVNMSVERKRTRGLI
jgi:hypothetical protein